jgi:serine/threonine-protein kinase
LVGVDGVSRITDFGIAFAVSRSTMTRDGRIKGKFSYMAPEQLTSQGATRRIDIFAAGIVLWEALTCRPLFRRKEDVATLNAVLAADIPAPSSIVKTVPSALDAVVLKALNRNPDERYQSAAQFADALEQLPIERATTRAVAAYVEDALGPVLAERRALIREASGQAEPNFGADSWRSDVHQKLIRVTGDEPIPSSRQAAALGAGLNDAPIEAPLPTAPPEHPAVAPVDIEHRRMRGLLAAAMLLLVGSAIGLLLARSGGGSSAAPVTAADPPNSLGSARPVQPPKPVVPRP